MKLCLLITVVTLFACSPTDHCRVNATRCAGAAVQVCDTEERWTDVMNCDEVAAQSGGAWSCQWLETVGGHTCLPADGGAR